MKKRRQTRLRHATTTRQAALRQAQGKKGKKEMKKRGQDPIRNYGQTYFVRGKRKTGGAWLIKLTFGKFAVIDVEDYDRVSQYNWCAIEDDRCWYAHTFKRDGTPLSMHRLITNAPKGLLVDHIDHNGLNNRKSNLRLCTNAQNQQNTRPRRGGTSRYKGVWLDKTRNVFMATISCNKKRYFLGRFKLETDAAKAYDKKAKELFGEFAYLNF